MTTFSQLVDSIAVELVRPDLLTSIASWANQTIRELHFRPGPTGQIPALYGENRFEDELVGGVDQVRVWALPRPARFQQLESAYSPTMGVYFNERNPTAMFRDSADPDFRFSRYRSGPNYVFSGLPNGAVLKLTWFEYVQSHGYIPAGAARTILFDPVDGTYSGPGVGDPVEETKQVNWMLIRWPEAVREGIRSKLYRRLGDEIRARMSYSAYESTRDMLWQTEGIV